MAHKNADLLRALDHALQTHFGWKYNMAVSKAPDTMNKINGLTQSISETSSQYNVPREVISAILVREITCYIPGEDLV